MPIRNIIANIQNAIKSYYRKTQTQAIQTAQTAANHLNKITQTKPEIRKSKGKTIYPQIIILKPNLT